MEKAILIAQRVAGTLTRIEWQTWRQQFKALSLKVRLVILAALVLAVLVLVGIIGRGDSSSDYGSVYVVQPITLRKEIKQRGVLSSLDTTPCLAQVSGLIEEIVPQGTQVKKGDIVFSMSSDETKSKIESEELSLLREQLKLERLEERLAFNEYKENTQLSILEAELAHAKLEQEYELAKPDERELAKLEVTRKLAALDLQDAKSDLERNQRLFDKNFISRSALEPFERKVETATVFLEERNLEIQLRNKGITDDRRVELQRAVDRAESKVQRFKNKIERKLNIIRYDIQATERRIVKLEFELEHYQERLGKTAIRAEVDGIVRILKYFDWRSGGQQVEHKPGIEKHPLDVVAEIINPEKMKIDLVINEADLNYIYEGMPVEIEVMAMPGRIFNGKVAVLGSIGRDRNRIDPTGKGSGSSGIMMFNAEIHFEGEGVSFRPGMSAMVSLIAEEAQERLIIPRQAVWVEDNAMYTYKKNLFGFEKTKVEGSVFNEMYFLLEAGIQEGDAISLEAKKEASRI